MIAGSFTGPGRTEVLAEYMGCEAHVTNFGGQLTFRKEQNRWRPVYIAPGADYLDRCNRFAKPDGHHDLVFESHYQGHGHYHGSVSIYSFIGLDEGAQRKSGFEKLLSFEKNTGACIDSGSKLIEEKISDWDMRHTDSGSATLTLTKHVRQATVPSQLDTSCDAPSGSKHDEDFVWKVRETRKTFEFRDHDSPSPREYDDYNNSLASQFAKEGRNIASRHRQIRAVAE